MAHFLLHPEVPGGLGEQTELDTSVHPPVVHKLHLEVAGWAGDDLVETFPVFLVSPRLRDAIVSADLTGATTRPALVTLMPGTEELVDPSILSFEWLDTTGEPGADDLGLDALAQLVVSDRALEQMRAHGQLGNCEVEPYSP
jgi:hypothetical protein